MKKIQKKRKGFTLIELVVVIVIIAILAAVALLRFGAFTESAKDSRIRSEHAQLITAGNMWRAAQPDPALAPEGEAGLAEIMKYMESTKPVTTGAHTLDEHGVLLSKLSKYDASDDKTFLTYDFKSPAN